MCITGLGVGKLGGRRQVLALFCLFQPVSAHFYPTSNTPEEQGAWSRNLGAAGAAPMLAHFTFTKTQNIGGFGSCLANVL